MDIIYKKDGNRNTMTIQNLDIDENNYKLQMVINNRIDGIMPMKIEHINNNIIINYNISSKTRLPDLYARKQMSGKELYSFIKDISVLVEKMSEYLLDINSIVFDIEMIYFNRQTGKYEFCYVPSRQEDFQVRIRDLFDKLLEYINHDDKEAVMIAYGIQQITIGADFTLQDILKCAYRNMREFQQEQQEKEIKKQNRQNEWQINKEQTDADRGDREVEKKKGILGTIQKLFRKKDKYKTASEMEWDDYIGTEEPSVVAEDTELYNQREERTMLLTNRTMVKPIVLTAVGTENPINIKPFDFPYIIGKSHSSCDFCIDSAVVSRVHLRILEELDDFMVEDLNSTNGTFLNGEKLKPHKPQLISIGDKLTIANIDFLVE